MRLNDPEYKRRIEMINTIPSNKFDNPNLNRYSEEDMERFEEHSDRMLREQVRAYSDHDKKVIIDELTKFCWIYVWNALGEYFNKVYKQKEETRKINEE